MFISRLLLIGACLAAAIGLGYLYIGTPSGVILWKCLPWGEFLNRPRPPRTQG